MHARYSDNFIEVPAIYGPVDAIVDKIMGNFLTNVEKKPLSRFPDRMSAILALREHCAIASNI